VAADAHAGLAVTIDLGLPGELHPPNKQEVGRRLARVARRVVYGEAVAASGPVPLAARRDADRIVVTFRDVEGQLAAPLPDRAAGFEVCGTEGSSCRAAGATFAGDSVTLDLPGGPPPARVRYCWGDSPVCDLRDRSGLPAGPFELPIGPITAVGSRPSPARAAPPLEALSFLVGEWEATGSGAPGRTAGRFSFTWTAERHALLRRNEAVTPSGRHEDVMLVYADPDGALRALYTDNEGHTIAYAVTVGGGRRVVFESSGEGPRYRLWYQLSGDGSLASGFEMAPPGSTEFRTYLEGTARRR
jgi:hypothetical protein